MGKVYKKLVESFGYIAEAPINATGYDPDKVQYAYQDGKANPNYPGAQVTPGPDTSNYTDPRGTDNVTNDPVKPKPKPKNKPGSGANAGTRAFQHWLNSKGIKVAVDGKWGSETLGGNEKYFNTYILGKKVSKELQDEYEAMRGVGTAHNVRIAPGSGNMYIGSPEYIAAMNKYGYDIKTGNPIGGAKTVSGPEPGQGDQPTPNTGGIVNLPELDKIPNKKNGMEYWINGSRYKYFVQTNSVTGQVLPGSGWRKNLDPSDKLQWNKNRALSSTGYTGPDDDDQAKQQWIASKKSSIPPTATSTPPGKTAESADLSAIKFLAGLK